MSQLMTDLFVFFGVDSYPQNMLELIPFMLKVLIALTVVKWLLSLFRYWSTQIFTGRMV
jgi:hypothetical protein